MVLVSLNERPYERPSVTDLQEVAQEIEDRADYLSREDVNWVPRAPEEPGESCMGYDYRSERKTGCNGVFSQQASCLLDKAAGSKTWPWVNDTAESRDDVVEFLRRAAKDIRNGELS